MYTLDDTIIALSTSAGRGAIGIIRISGDNTLNILVSIVRNNKNLELNKDYFFNNIKKVIRCNFVINDQIIDDGICVFFKSPHSYTGEDLAELYIHGNPLIAKKIINFIADNGWARPSLPGEFTRRAFFHGKMDLTKAESIHRIITAKSEYELNSIKKIYFGEFYRFINKIRSDIILLKAHIEAEVDFSDQDIDYSERTFLISKINKIIASIDDILKQSAIASKIVQGLQITLVGRTNAGKSSLMNKILGWDRSIVSEVEGTTRDYIAEEIELAGLSVRIVDTAGLRETKDIIEQEGIRRSKEVMDRSQIVLHIIDGSIPQYNFLAEIKEYISHKESDRKIIHIINKKDILHTEAWNESKLKSLGQHDVIVHYISCKTGEGIKELKELIEKLIIERFPQNNPFLLEERHHYHFSKIKESLYTVLNLWKERAPDEIVAIEIQNAINHIAELTGEITTEDVLGRIFSMFCIGK